MARLIPTALPAALRPWWPAFKRAHRMATVLLGILFRRVAPLLGERGVPRRATATSVQTVCADPAAVTLHPGGPAEELRRPIPAGEPARHWCFVAARQAHVRPRHTLEIAGGRLVGEFGAVLTPAGVLDFETSGYFGIDGWREHPVFLHPTLGRVEHVAGTVLGLATRGAERNYYHFLYDALARYGIFEECLPGRAVDAIVVPHRTGYQRQLLALVGIDAPLIEPDRTVTVRADRLLVPSMPNAALDAPRWVVDWLRRRLPPTPGAAGPRRLYLSRGAKPNTRRYVQEAELTPWLERHGFVTLDPGSLSVQEQIDVFAGAEVVVAPHGAALTNITFCRPGARVLELFPADYVHLGLWTIAAAIDGITYRYLVAPPAPGDPAARPGRPMRAVHADVDIEPRLVTEAIEALLDIPTERRPR